MSIRTRAETGSEGHARPVLESERNRRVGGAHLTTLLIRQYPL